MSDSDDALPIRVVGPVSIARLHGRACWYCGAVARPLFPAGKVQLVDGGRIWAVVTCGCHARGGYFVDAAVGTQLPALPPDRTEWEELGRTTADDMDALAEQFAAAKS